MKVITSILIGVMFLLFLPNISYAESERSYYPIYQAYPALPTSVQIVNEPEIFPAFRRRSSRDNNYLISVNSYDQHHLGYSPTERLQRRSNLFAPLDPG